MPAPCEHRKRGDHCLLCRGLVVIAERMFYAAKHRAVQKNIPFLLSIRDVMVLLENTGRKCPVLGLEFAHSMEDIRDWTYGVGNEKGRGPRLNAASLDRHKPELGYVLGNVSIISQLANVIRNSGTSEQIQKVAEYARRVE